MVYPETILIIAFTIKCNALNRRGSWMHRCIGRARHNPVYWRSWGLSAGTHTVIVGVALILSHALPVPKKVEQRPITVSFVAPQPTQPRTTPAHRPTVKRPPLTPTTQTTQRQPDPIPKKPPQSRTHTQTPIRRAVSPRTIVQPSLTPSPQPLVRPNGVTRTPMVQSPAVQSPTVQFKAVVQAQASSHPAITNGDPAPQPLSRSIGTTRQRTAAKVHASTFSPRVTKVPQPVGTLIGAPPRRQSVHTLPSHEKKVIRAPAIEAMQHTQYVTRATVSHVSSRTLGQRVSLRSEKPVVQTRTTTRHVHQTRRTAATISRSGSTDGFSPELLAFSKLLREKIAQTLEFPRLAKRLGYSGTTHVVITLSKTGVVQALNISRPSGYDILDKAAVATLKKVLSTVKPPESINVAQLAVPIDFNLKSR